MKNKKGQAAIEFLKGYGWIAAVLIGMLGTLAYLGYLDPEKIMPAPCVMEKEGISCTKHKIEPVKITLTFKNNLRNDIIVNNIRVNDCEGTFSDELKNGEENEFIINACKNGAINSNFKSELVVTYTEKNSGVQKKAIGQIKTLIQ